MIHWCFSIIQTYLHGSDLLPFQTKLLPMSLKALSLPTPVGPRNKNDPIGRFGLLSPTLLLFTAFATALTASSCPITYLWSSFSRFRKRSISPFVSCVTGICVHKDTTSAASSTVNCGISFSFLCVRLILR